MARVLVIGTLERVKKGTYNGKPDNALVVESGDDNVMIDIPEGADTTQYELNVGQDVQVPCIVTMRKSANGSFIKYRLRPMANK